MNKLIILSAPSGSGKTTIMRRVTAAFPQLEFSISATSRAPRGEEKHGVEYYFLSPSEFREGVIANKFAEWEEVYDGCFYGTLRSEMERIWAAGHVIIFDVDVRGGVKLKELFGSCALSIFIMPPSVAVLRERLISRATDSAEAIDRRVAKAEEEIAFAQQFDITIVNDNLDVAVAEVEEVVSEFIR